MTKIILSADREFMLYLVPDEVADNLDEYCLKFCHEWLNTSPDAEKYRFGAGFCFNEADFIDYLNEYVFPEQKSVFIKNIGWKIPNEYKNIPHFNF